MPKNFTTSIIRYSGIKAVLSGSFTLSHGVSPSRATIYMAPQETPLPVVGWFVLEDDYGRINFPDCKAQVLNVEINGTTVWSVTLMDFRWRWCFGEISGEYNVRDANGKLIIESIRSTKQLAKLLLDALGVQQPNIDLVPENQFPEKRWEIAHPDQELATLCEQIGFRVVVGPNNAVALWPEGRGQILPKSRRLLDVQQLFELPDAPDTLIYRPGRTQLQCILPLIAVAGEGDGEIKKLHEVSYAPAHPDFPVLRDVPWGTFDEPFANAIFPPVENPPRRQFKKGLRDLANKWVYRAYRVDLSMLLPPLEPLKFNGEVLTDLDRILPLNQFQLVKRQGNALEVAVRDNPFRKVEDRQGPPAVVFGRWSRVNSALHSTNLDVVRTIPVAQMEAEADAIGRRPKLTGNLLLAPWEQYQDAWSLDAERGLVIFSQPVYEVQNLVIGDDVQPVKFPAAMFLITSFGIRDKITRAWHHAEVRRVLPGKKYGTPPQHIYKSEVEYREWIDNNVVGRPALNNREEIERVGKFYLDAAQQRLQLKTPASATYAGFMRLAPDGAIQQISWFIDDEGFCKTRASRNRDEPDLGETYQQKRIYEQLAGLLSGNKQESDREERRFGA